EIRDSNKQLSLVRVVFGPASGAARDERLQVTDLLLLPLRRVAKLRKPQAGAVFAFAGEELLHQPILVVLERVELPAFRFDQLVQRAQALGDLLLFGERWGRDLDVEKCVPTYVQ